MHQITVIYQFLQEHPLYWQVTLSLLVTSGVFEWLKKRLALEGKKKITAYLSLIAAAQVGIHSAIVGLTFVGPVGFLQQYGQQVLLLIGALNLTYNFLTTTVTKFLQDAKAAAKDDTTTPTSKSVTLPVSAEDFGVVNI